MNLNQIKDICQIFNSNFLRLLKLNVIFIFFFWLFVFCFLFLVEGNQNVSTQNMPLWHKNCFELNTIKNSKPRQSFPFSAKRQDINSPLTTVNLSSPEMAPHKSTNETYFISFLPYIYLSNVCHPWKLETAFFCPVNFPINVLSFVKNTIQTEILRWHWIVLCLDFSQVMCSMCINKLFFSCKLSFIVRVPAENLKWVEVKFCLLYVVMSMYYTCKVILIYLSSWKNWK